MFGTGKRYSFNRIQVEVFITTESNKAFMESQIFQTIKNEQRKTKKRQITETAIFILLKETNMTFLLKAEIVERNNGINYFIKAHFNFEQFSNGQLTQKFQSGLFNQAINQ